MKGKDMNEYVYVAGRLVGVYPTSETVSEHWSLSWSFADEVPFKPEPKDIKVLEVLQRFDGIDDYQFVAEITLPEER